MRKLPFWTRRIVAWIAFFIAVIAFATSTGFLDKNPSIRSIVDVWALIQPGPAILRTAESVGWALAIVIGWFAATVLFGRIFCGWVCPWGILQDGVDFIARKIFRIGAKKKPAHEANHPLLRTVLCVCVLGFLAAGWAIGFRLLDPYSNFGALVNTAKSSAGSGDLGAPSLAAILTGGIPFLILIALVIWKRRIYCTSLCPVGTLLGWTASYSFFGWRIGESCKKCGACAKACPSGCIDYAEKTLDSERCVHCEECKSVCRFGAISFGIRSLVKRETPLPANESSIEGTESPKRQDKNERRNFLMGIGSGFLGYAVAQAYKPSGTFAASDAKEPSGENGVGQPIAQRGIKREGRVLTEDRIYPPGAGSSDRFAALCTACQRCVSQCMGNTLQTGGNGYPPHLQFATGMCEYECKRCGEVCPTGAIRHLTLDEKKHCRIGKVEFDRSLCVTIVNGDSCGACAEHCPTGAVRMRDSEEGESVSVPHITPELCIGCGNCENPCPVRPKKAIRVLPVSIQVKAEDPQAYFRRTAPPLPVSSGEEKKDDWAF
jgi:polyferredoxin